MKFLNCGYINKRSDNNEILITSNPILLIITLDSS